MKTNSQRQERIVEILSLLHQGGSFEEAKRLFNEEFDGVDVMEITAAEKALIQTGWTLLKFSVCAIFMLLFSKDRSMRSITPMKNMGNQAILCIP